MISTDHTEVEQHLSGPDRCRPRPPSASLDPRTCDRTACRPRGDMSVCTKNKTIVFNLFYQIYSTDLLFIVDTETIVSVHLTISKYMC